jgi:hypothetical protein
LPSRILRDFLVDEILQLFGQSSHERSTYDRCVRLVWTPLDKREFEKSRTRGDAVTVKTIGVWELLPFADCLLDQLLSFFCRFEPPGTLRVKGVQS